MTLKRRDAEARRGVVPLIKCLARDAAERQEIYRVVREMGLDRRRVYTVGYGGELATCGTITISCSGCTETVDGHNSFRFPVDPKHGCLVGGGCHECGFTGKRREMVPLPVQINGEFVWIGKGGETGEAAP